MMTNEDPTMTDDPILEITELKKHFTSRKGIINKIRGSQKVIQAVDGVSLSISENDSIGIIGESGCGKSTLAMTLVGLHEPTGGRFTYDGDAVSEFSRKDWKRFRSDVQIVFQNPFDSLDPKLTVRESLEQPLIIHSMDERDRRIRDVLRRVELDPPSRYMDRLPSNLSGGEKQRVSIARALIVEPNVLIADEPVSMLDVSTQASILKLLADLKSQTDLSILYISHDLSTVSYVADKIGVMYLGRIVEFAPAKELISDPKHPYSQALVDAIPVPEPDGARQRTEMEGAPAEPINLGPGCRFRDRCPERMDICEKTPNSVTVEGQSRTVACHLYYDHMTNAKEESGNGFESSKAGGE